MSRIGITFEEVVEAALSIERDGETPTLDKVRAYLGGTGSFTTISKFLQQWRNKIVHGYADKESRASTPDIVKVAVDRVWSEIKEQSDKEIDSIKIEAQAIIAAAEKKVELAEANLKQLKDEYDQLHEVHIAQSSEKELLQLDNKTLREEYGLLRERYKVLEERYAEMQSLTSQHLKNLSQAHQKEVQRLEEAYKSQMETHEKLVDVIKDQNEKERQNNIVVIDNLKIECKKLKETIEKLQMQNQEKIVNIKNLESDLNILKVERNNLSDRIEERDKKWSYFDDKTLISNDILKKIYDTPKIDNLMEKINIVFESSVEKKFLEFKEDFKYFEISTFLKDKGKEV